LAASAIDTAKHVLLACAVILAAGSLSGLLARRLAVPDVVVYLIVGIALGPQAAGWVDIRADSALNQIILVFGACYILFDGGASLRLSVLKQVWITIAVIATIGVVITGAVTALAAYSILGVPLIVALLLGAATASTDPATLVPVFRQVRIRERVAQTVMSESALNDATGAILTFGVLAVAMGRGEFSLGASLAELARQALFGLLVGAALGYLAALFIAHERLAFLVEYAPLVTLMAVIAAYLGADDLQASGFMAVFTFGLVLGNKDAFGFKMGAREQERLDEFVATTALIMRMFIFILLGAQVDFALMNRYLLGGIAVVAVFMLVARPLAVLLCAWPDRRARWSWQEMLFMCWTRETGVIPAALAGLLLGMKAPGAEVIASVTFIAVLMTIVIQATTTR
jgi:cell volume regulation protein A